MAEPLAIQLEALLSTPREDLGVEIKSWLDLSVAADCAKLAKAALALANHGGGFIILGLRETAAGRFEPAPDRPETLAGYTQDVIARVVAAYAEPAFQVGVHHVETARGTYPVIQAPGGHRTPIQAKKGSPDQKTLVVGRVYTRRPGPESAEPATAAEWKELIDRCVRAGRDDLLDAIRGVLDGRAPEPIPVATSDAAQLAAWAEEGLKRWEDLAPKTPTQTPMFPPGYCRVAYRVLGDGPEISLPDLLAAIDRSTTRYTGWSPWWVPTRDAIRPYVKDGALECFLGEDGGFLNDPAHADFWRVTPQGEALLVRGYDEDSYPSRTPPGTAFDVTLPVWRIGDCLLQAARFAAAIGRPEAEILFSVQWAGLAGRELKALEGRRHLHEGRIARQDVLNRMTTVRAAQVADQLPEILHGLLTPLYALFDLFILPKSLVDEEVQKLRGGRF